MKLPFTVSKMMTINVGMLGVYLGWKWRRSPKVLLVFMSVILLNYKFGVEWVNRIVWERCIESRNEIGYYFIK